MFREASVSRAGETTDLFLVEAVAQTAAGWISL
jgi:hypothetical protein